MNFVKSQLKKMKLWPVVHFWLTFFPDQCRSGKKWAKSVQLVRVSFLRSDFLQNPYFTGFTKNKKKKIMYLFNIIEYCFLDSLLSNEKKSFIEISWYVLFDIEIMWQNFKLGFKFGSKVPTWNCTVMIQWSGNVLVAVS